MTIQAGYESILSRRYLLDRKPYRKGNSRAVFERDLQEDDSEDGTPPWLTDDKFLQKYRMHCDSFKMIVSLINNHPAFKSKGKKPQAPIEHQLMVFLFTLEFLVVEQVFLGAIKCLELDVALAMITINML